MRDVLIDAVERQMMGDVPVGVFLSGGLDSRLVAAIAARYLRERGRCCRPSPSAREGSPDLLAARTVAEYLGTEHHERSYTAEEARGLPGVIASIEAFDPRSCAAPCRTTCSRKFTSKHVKVVLTGEGADELFAGYEYMREFHDPARCMPTSCAASRACTT